LYNTPIPYPVATIGADTMICFETTAQLHGSINGSSFIWSPASSLQFANTLNPLAIAKTTTTYILAAYDTKGCPKPGLDSVIVTVLPEIKAFAGNDTSVVINQPLQFNASGGDSYTWSPATGLSASNIATPVGIYSAPTEGIKYRVITSNAAGCSDSAFVTVKVYKVLPSVFVPTGFTPNNDGRNDVLKPIAAGMQSISLFAVYNRLGQMIFSASESGKGWDGTFNGTPQNSGTYVWLVKATDYTGKPYFEKGTVTLIR
jgi:gliding motility-associated-like protein